MSDYVWVLNPDCERELAAKRSYEVRDAFKARIAERRALFDGLVQGEPAFFTHEQLPQGRFNEARALLWCPTPHALGVLADSGLRCAAHPSVEVLRRVHDKRFVSSHCSDLALPGRRVIESSAEWQACLSTMTEPLRTKRIFGYAGKGQRVWRRGGKDDPNWLTESFRQGGFIVEPNLESVEQLSMHGFVDARGAICGVPCQLSTDAHGAPTGVAQVCSELLQKRFDAGRSIERVTLEIAQRLAGAGYFGPFGIDLLWVEEHPKVIDINPRFTLGWSIGMGKLRREGIARALEPVRL